MITVLPLAVVAAPALPLLMVLGALAIVITLKNPFLACLSFIALSFFRLHEAYPVLFPFHLPFAFAVLTTMALVWHVLLARTIQPFWPKEIKLFCIFFVVVTLGIPYALDRRLALDAWLAVYSKIAIMTVAISWLARTSRDFELLARVFVVAGLLVAGVAIRNKLLGSDLVEFTRVTIGRDLDSVLGDPNDLALVLLFPLSFALALLIHRCGLFNRLLGLVSTPALLLAISYTQSRGGLLGVLAVLTAFALRTVKSKTVVCGVAVVAAIALYHGMGMAERTHSGAPPAGLDESAADRLDAWSTAVDMALTRPLTGVGYANFADSVYFFAEKHQKRDIAAHSTWFGVLAETGLPGFILFMAMIVATFRSALQSYRTLHAHHSPEIARALAIALLAGLAGFCTSGSFLTQGFTWPIYILVALAAALSRYATLTHGICPPGSRASAQGWWHPPRSEEQSSGA